MKKKFIFFMVLFCLLISFPVFAAVPEFTDFPPSSEGFPYYMIIKQDVAVDDYDGWVLLYLENPYGLILNWNNSLLTPAYAFANFSESMLSSYIERFPDVTADTNSRVEKWVFFNNTDGRWVKSGVYDEGFSYSHVGGVKIKLSGEYALFYHNFDIPLILANGSWLGDDYPANPFRVTVREVIRQFIPVLPRTILQVGSVVLPKLCLILAIFCGILLIKRFLLLWIR